MFFVERSLTILAFNNDDQPIIGQAISDGAQSLTIGGFREMMRQLAGYIELWKQERVGEMAVA